MARWNPAWAIADAGEQFCYADVLGRIVLRRCAGEARPTGLPQWRGHVASPRSLNTDYTFTMAPPPAHIAVSRLSVKKTPLMLCRGGFHSNSLRTPSVELCVPPSHAGVFTAHVEIPRGCPPSRCNGPGSTVTRLDPAPANAKHSPPPLRAMVAAALSIRPPVLRVRPALRAPQLNRRCGSDAIFPRPVTKRTA